MQSSENEYNYTRLMMLKRGENVVKAIRERTVQGANGGQGIPNISEDF
jgi:hypothetical protein